MTVRILTAWATILAASLAAMVAAAPAGAAELIGPQALKQDWFDGRAITTAGPRGGKSEMTFKPDGTLTRTGGRPGSAGAGTWRLDEEGFCMRLGTAKRESCYLAVRGEDQSIRVLRRSGRAFVWTR